MKQRLFLFVFCILLLIGVLYWLIPQVTALYEETNVGVTPTLQQPTATVASRVITRPTIQAQSVQDDCRDTPFAAYCRPP